MENRLITQKNVAFTKEQLEEADKREKRILIEKQKVVEEQSKDNKDNSDNKDK
jgi:hypothetical protein